MLGKLQQIFLTQTSSSENTITDPQHFDHLLKKLSDRKILIEHDINLLKKYTIAFPLNFDQFLSTSKQIFKLDLESILQDKIFNFEDTFNKIIKFLNFYNYNDLDHEDLYEILSNFNINIENIKSTLKNINKIEFLLKNIRDDIQKFLWDKIAENASIQKEDLNPEFFFQDANDYQNKMQAKIEYEYQIIITKRAHYNLENLNHKNKRKLIKKILVEKAICADRGIPIHTWKIPNNFYDKNQLSEFYFKCEALGQLLLSKHFQKFTGFDDLSFDDFQIYFLEFLDGQKLSDLICDQNLEESSILFKYLAKEILCAFRDLLYKSTFSIKNSITIENIFYEKNQLRLYFNNLKFGPIRKNILESHQFVEAKFLHHFALILLDLLSYNKPELKELKIFINSICEDFSEFEQMQKFFDHIFYIEEVLSKHLESDVVICIIVECLISPCKAKMVFDEFYNDKNFLKDVFTGKDNLDNILSPVKKQTDFPNFNDDNAFNDKFVVNEPYYSNNDNLNLLKEEKNEILPKKIMTLNLLLIHPFFDNLNLDSNFVSFLFKNI